MVHGVCSGAGCLNKFLLDFSASSSYSRHKVGVGFAVQGIPSTKCMEHTLSLPAGQKAVSEATKWQIIGMKNGSMISHREIASRLLISENCFRNTRKTFQKTAKKILRSANAVLYFVKN